MKTLFAALAGLIACACAPPASAAVLTATPSDLTAVVKLLKPGDTLQLVGAFADDFRPKGAMLSGVTIRAEKATFTGAFYPGGGAIEKLTIVGGAWRTMRFDGASDLLVTGGAAFSGAGVGTGLAVNGGRNITVIGSPFDNLQNGIALLRVDGFRVEGNAFSLIVSDGVNVGESRNGRIVGNLCHGFRPAAATHPDCVQLWSRPTSPPTSDILIEGNRAFGNMQGVFAGNHVRNGVDDGGFDRITIRRNELSVGYSHGVAIGSARGSVVEGNTVTTYPGARYRASINVDGVRRCGNSVAPGAGKPGVVDGAC